MKKRQMDIVVTCDACSETYQPELVAAPTDAGGEYQSFTCPHCKAEYPVCTITKHGLEIREQIKHLRESVKTKPHLGPHLADAMKKFDRECKPGQKPQ
jgi:uncharacterized protein YbaR (Trm112 family)